MATHHPVALTPERLDESLTLRRGPDARPTVGQPTASQRTKDDLFRQNAPTTIAYRPNEIEILRPLQPMVG